MSEMIERVERLGRRMTGEEYAEALETMSEIIMDADKCGRLEAKITMERAAKFIRALATTPKRS